MCYDQSDVQCQRSTISLMRSDSSVQSDYCIMLVHKIRLMYYVSALRSD